MRNLKQSYKSTKDNNKKTSTDHGQITWKWYDTMEDLFKEDRTINVGAMLSSINSEINNNQESSTSSLPSTTEDEHITNTVHLDIDYVHSEITENISESSVRCVKKFIKGNSYVYDWLKNCVHDD